MSVFLLKIVAIICMVCDHIRYVLPNANTEAMRLLGRIAFPIFAFLIVEGFVHTKDLKKYIMRLGLFAVLSEYPFILFTIGCKIYNEISLNVMFTLLCGVVVLFFYDKVKTTFLSLIKNDNSQNNMIKRIILLFSYIVSIVLIGWIANELKMDYGAFGIIIILLFYIFREKNILKNVLIASVFIISLLLKLFFEYNMNLSSLKYCIPYMAGYICAAVILMQYNGKVGKYKMKYFFYLFYPVHMVVMYLIYKYITII